MAYLIFPYILVRPEFHFSDKKPASKGLGAGGVVGLCGHLRRLPHPTSHPQLHPDLPNGQQPHGR